MKIKTLIIGIGFAVAVFMAGSLSSTDKSPEIWRFINKFDDVTKKIDAELNNQNESDDLKRIDNAQAILEQINKEDGLQMKESLKSDLGKLRVSGDIQTTETTEHALNKCLKNNVERILQVYRNLSDSIISNMKANKSAKTKDERTIAIQNLASDQKILNKLELVFKNYNSILD